MHEIKLEITFKLENLILDFYNHSLKATLFQFCLWILIQSVEICRLVSLIPHLYTVGGES